MTFPSTILKVFCNFRKNYIWEQWRLKVEYVSWRRLTNEQGRSTWPAGNCIGQPLVEDQGNQVPKYTQHEQDLWDELYDYIGVVPEVNMVDNTEYHTQYHLGDTQDY